MSEVEVMTTKQQNILTEYERYLTLKKIKTLGQYISSVKEYLEYLDSIGEKYDTIGQMIGDEYRTYLFTGDKSLSRPTINNKLNRVKSFYRFLLKKGYIGSNPFYRLENLKCCKNLPRNILNVGDMGRLLDDFSILTNDDIMLKSIVELLYGSGLRISEVVTLKLSDIDFDNGYICITESKNNDKRRRVVAGEVSLKTLKHYLKGKKINSADYLYPQKKEGSIKNQLNAKLKRECRRLNLKTVTSHSFRHSIATHILRAGVGIREVQEFLGHKKIASTEIYTRVVVEDLKNIIEKCHPRELELNDE